MLDIYIWSVLITAIFFTSFGFFAYIKNSKELSAKLFSLLSLAFAIWSYSWFFLLLTKDETVALFFAKLLTFGATFIPVFYLHWSLSIVELVRKRKILIFVSYTITIIFAFISFTDLYVPGVRPILFFNFWPIAGPAYTVFIIFGYFGLVFYSVFELIRGYIYSGGDKRYQIGYLLAGTLLGFGGGATNFPLMYGITSIQPIGIFAVMVGPFLFSYAVVKYKLMNIKVVATQFFVGAMNVVFLINLILSKNSNERFFNILLFVIVLYFTILVIRGVRNEVSQREKIEKLAGDLEEVNERLTELNKQKSEFVSFATHQIRAPLTAMKGYASLILEGDMGELDPEAKKAVSRIYDSTNTLTAIVEDYLNLTRIELGTMKYSFETIDLKRMVEDVIAELKPNIEKSKLAFSFTDEDAGSDYRIVADRDKLKQVIANLIDNAIKYTPSGSISVSISCDRARHVCIYSVKDTGVGMSPETIPKLFKKFSRADNANKANFKGTGLGLYVAHEIITAHHGTIKAQSPGEGKGSIFTVELESISK